MKVSCARAFVAALSSVACACTTIGSEKVDGWPELSIVAHYVPASEMRARCARYMPFGFVAQSCAEFDFVAAECHVWFNRDFPPQRAVVEHERSHCLGYDHAGEHTLSRLLERHSVVEYWP
jgi:hypothetical protein